MWRRGFETPVNPNDNELNCGGFQVRNLNYCFSEQINVSDNLSNGHYLNELYKSKSGYVSIFLEFNCITKQQI